MSEMVNKFEEFTKRPTYSLFGIVGAIIICVGCLITAIGYVGPLGQRYSLFNYFISELGGGIESEWAIVFNISIFVGALMFGVFNAGLWFYFKSKWGKIGCIFGVFSSIAGALVGVFPFDGNIIAHGLSAMGFFYGGMFTVIFYTIAIFVEKNSNLPKYLGYFGIIGAVIFIIFNFTLSGFSTIFSEGGMPEDFSIDDIRVDGIWDFATFEWLALLSVIFWMCLTAIAILRMNNRTIVKKPEV
jgi:hypothetical protein